MCLQRFIHAFAPLHEQDDGADDPDLSVALTRSIATLSSPDLLYIIRGNGYFSQDVGDTSFLLWEGSDIYFAAIRY